MVLLTRFGLVPWMAVIGTGNGLDITKYSTVDKFGGRRGFVWKG
jgi:hypothetical protein